MLRIGGSSQDQVPFDAAAADSDRYVTPHDLVRVRQTLDAVGPGWVTALGTALAPPTEEFPGRVDHAVAFARDGVAPVFGDAAGRSFAGLALGNEPDLTYEKDLARYLADFSAYTGAEFVNRWPRVVPATSEPIGTWQSIRDRTIDTRWFWEWPAILDHVAPTVRGTFATGHCYPLARGCSTDPYRCATIERLLSQERMDNFGYEVYTHATEAARRGLRYRMDETNSAGGRGAQGVSDVAASATWTLDTLFNAACPQPPDQPGANTDCRLGATGVNVHNAEVNRYFAPEEGNAFYNAIRYDPTPALGPPTVGPSYYALLLFARLAQGTSGLRPLPASGSLRAWRTSGRVFLINKGAAPVTVSFPARVGLHRMTPRDPTGAGRTLDAPEVRIDGRAVAPDGTFGPLVPAIVRGPVTVAPERRWWSLVPGGLDGFDDRHDDVVDRQHEERAADEGAHPCPPRPVPRLAVGGATTSATFSRQPWSPAWPTCS